MIILIIILAAWLAARSLYKRIAVDRIEAAAPDVLEALIALRSNLGVANRANSAFGRELLEQADRAVYKALGLECK